MSQHLKLRQKSCRSCHKCIRHCPLKAIRFSGGHARIVAEDCIWCGLCYTACPQSGNEIFSERYTVEGLLHAGDRVVASVDASYAAQYPGATIGDLQTALRSLGFAGAGEAAAGAGAVTAAYDRLLAEGADVLLSSTCPSANLLIQKYYPAALPLLAPVLSPVQVHAAALKEADPGCKVVFIGPCIAQKDEVEALPGYIDAVLTFDQLDSWLAEKSIAVRPTGKGKGGGKTACTALPGGLVRAMQPHRSNTTYLSVCGVKACMEALQQIADGQLHHCFVELTACEGGCAGGPGRRRGSIVDLPLIEKTVKNKPYQLPFSGSLDRSFEPLPRTETPVPEEALREILLRMGKTTPEDELNCGGCGYSTCRDKAAAIYRGKANASMCLPYLKAKAETFSDTIINNTPNGVIVLNEELEVQQINRAALNMLGIRHRIDIMGEPLSAFMDEAVFAEPLARRQRVSVRRLYREQSQTYLEITTILDPEYHIVMGVLRNVTEETLERQKKESITAQTVEIADKVVEKQMRIVQEIASLLGETTAETKIALSKLKESITDESALR